MTTVANGLWTSAPPELESAMGKKPNEATAAVMITGRRRTEVPFKIRSLILVMPSFFNSLKYPISTIPFNTATPNKGNESNSSRDAKWHMSKL